MAIYGDGGHQNFILIPEEDGGKGWRRMKEVFLEVTQTDRNQVGFVGVEQRKPWKVIEGG